MNLAVLYNDLGRYAEAKKLYGHLQGKHKGETAEIEPVLRGRLSNMHADLGDVYRSIGLYVHAAVEYKKALDFNPVYADIRTKLGMALREAGKTQESLAELKRALKDKPRYLTAKVQLGISYYTAGKLKEARKEWEEVLKLDPANESAKTYLKLGEKK